MSRSGSINVQTILCLALAGILVGATIPGALEAQRGRNNGKKLLILPPLPGDGVDSAYVRQLADAIRDRMDSKLRFKMRVVPKSKISEALQASGFEPDAILDDGGVAQLAEFLQADAYAVGRARKNSEAPEVDLRLVDLRRSGLAGWVHVKGGPGVQPKDLAKVVVDSLENQVDAAKSARECIEKRDRQDYKGARQRAAKAFQRYPNHPAASICMADVYEASGESPDSLIAMLVRATEGDSLNSRVWERLGRRYQQKGDTLRAVQSFEHQLAANPGDFRLRLGLAATYNQLQDFERARDLINEGLKINPADLPSLKLKARTCVDGELWDCALEAFQAEYELDSALVGDTIFYAQAIGAAQQLGDTEEALKWTGEAVKNVPNSVQMWRARAAALKDAGMPDEALDAYGHLIALDSTDVTALLASAQILIEGTPIDTGIPLDTAPLLRADSLLQKAQALASDDGTRNNIAALYFQPGARLAQKQLGLALAVDFLEKALANDVTHRLTTNGNFYLGLAYFLHVLRNVDPKVREAQSCEMVDEEEAMLKRGREALTVGQSVAQGTAQRLLQGYAQMEGVIPKFRQAWCS